MNQFCSATTNYRCYGKYGTKIICRAHNSKKLYFKVKISFKLYEPVAEAMPTTKRSKRRINPRPWIVNEQRKLAVATEGLAIFNMYLNGSSFQLAMVYVFDISCFQNVNIEMYLIYFNGLN